MKSKRETLSRSNMSPPWQGNSTKIKTISDNYNIPAAVCKNCFDASGRVRPSLPRVFRTNSGECPAVFPMPRPAALCVFRMCFGKCSARCPMRVPKVGYNCMNVTFADLLGYIFAKNDYICEINEKN